MSHLNDVIARVDATIEESVITHMNELLIELSDDAELSREDRYTQQHIGEVVRIAVIRHPAEQRGIMLAFAHAGEIFPPLI